MLKRLVHSNYWPGLKKDVQFHLATGPHLDKFHNPSKRQRGKQNPIPKNTRADILAIDLFGGKASLPESPQANRYILTMIDLLTEFGVAAAMLEQPAQTVADDLLSRCALVFGAPRRLLTDQGGNFES